LAYLVVAYSWPRWSRRWKAHALIEQGFHEIRQNWIAGLPSANTLFREALELDPSQAAAYAGLAELMARNVDASREQAAIFAQRPVRLDPRCARCQAIAGWILITRQWRFREGASYLERALALDPRDPQTLLWHAQMLACSGRLERALSEIEQARALDFKARRGGNARRHLIFVAPL
jgi:thioredoxin-like negative regulator of GroEL